MPRWFRNNDTPVWEKLGLSREQYERLGNEGVEPHVPADIEYETINDLTHAEYYAAIAEQENNINSLEFISGSIGEALGMLSNFYAVFLLFKCVVWMWHGPEAQEQGIRIITKSEQLFLLCFLLKFIVPQLVLITGACSLFNLGRGLFEVSGLKAKVSNWASKNCNRRSELETELRLFNGN